MINQTRLTYLFHRTRELGNHYQKYSQAIHQIFPLLKEHVGKGDRHYPLEIGRLSPNICRDMKAIAALTVDERTKLNLLGCYYAIQFLWLNISNLDWLDYQLMQSRSRQKIYQKFILDTGTKFRRLTAAYIEQLIAIFSGGRPLPVFVITGVGTRSDQDDIDVGIIDDGSPQRHFLNQVIGKIGQEMIRFASTFHFHLSEHVGHQAYSASIPEYEELLDEIIGNYIILTEMLVAAVIVGDLQLFGQFQERVTRRYYYDGKPNRYHEGYLRGILGEVVDLYSNAIDQCYLHPKHDGLRIIKNIIYAYKTILNIPEVNPWGILKKMKRINPSLKNEYHILQSSLTFLEIFRYLYQQLVVQEESILASDDVIKSNLQRVAVQLHYKNFGPHQAVYELLQDYRKAVEAYRRVVPILLKDLSAHLGKISVLNSVFRERKKPKKIFADFYSQLVFFQSVQFWEDILQALQNPDHPFPRALVTDLEAMDAENRTRAVQSICQWAGNNPEFLFKLILCLNQAIPPESHELLNHIISHYLSLYQNDPEFLNHIIALYKKDSVLVFHVLRLCYEENLLLFKNVLFQKAVHGEEAVYQKSLVHLLDLMSGCSHFFIRFLTRFFEQCPQYPCHIWHPERIEELCNKLMIQLPLIKSLEKKKEKLGEYYDLKFFQLGLLTLRGMEVERINRQFKQFTSTYFQELFKICLSQSRKIFRVNQRVLDNIAIYSCGGNGREQAFDDDYDLIILVDSQSEQEKQFYREVLALMNTELIKRGTLPHFRFISHFGEYFCPFRELKEMIRTAYTESYIDKSQLLEARLLVGSPRFHKKFVKEIIQQSIFPDFKSYMQQMVDDIYKRHGSMALFRTKCANIKECAGGLRDIEMAILIYKVYYKLLETNPYKLIQRFCEKNHDLQEDWQRIRKSLVFLQQFRYVYRLSIAAEDQIYSEHLENVANRLCPDGNISMDKTEWLWQQFVHYRKEAWDSVRKLIRILE
ncbi:MAG: hypothetical protein Kow0042_07360 [Calditrichia bacterium]